MALVGIKLGIDKPAGGQTVLGPSIAVQIRSLFITVINEGEENEHEIEKPVDSLTIEVTDEQGTAKASAQTFSNVKGKSTTFTTFKPGKTKIKATAKAGFKDATQTRQITLEIDAVPPAVSVLAPTNNQVILGPGPTFPVAVRITASDASGVVKGRFALGNVIVDVPVSPASSPVTLEQSLTLQGLGTHLISVTATDARGNTALALPIQVSAADSGPPDLRITSHPTDRPTTVTWRNEGVDIEIAGSASDPTTKVKSVEWQLDQGELSEDDWKPATNVSGTWFNTQSGALLWRHRFSARPARRFLCAGVDQLPTPRGRGRFGTGCDWEFTPGLFVRLTSWPYRPCGPSELLVEASTPSTAPETDCSQRDSLRMHRAGDITVRAYKMNDQ